MSVTISKGRMFRVTIAVDDERLKAMREAPEKAQAALQVAANHWHDKILPRHFVLGAAARYGYAPRAPKYLKNRQKQGKPSLVFSGSLRRDLRSQATFRIASKTTIDLKMSARVLNLATRMPENSPDLYVKHKNGRGYPNLKREIKAITDEEREEIAQIATRELELAFGPTEDKTTSLIATGAAA